MNQQVIDILIKKYAPHKPFTPRSVFIGIPCHDAKVCVQFMDSFIQTLKVLGEHGINVQTHAECSGGICLARQEICYEFMTTTHEALFFLDGDVFFTPDDFMRVLCSPADISVGVYPLKRLDIQRLVPGMQNRDPDVLSKAMDYPINISAEARTGGIQKIDIPGFIEVEEAATGFMRIKRNVIGRIQIDNENLRYCNDLHRNQYALFNNTMDYCPERATPLFRGEDYSFCKLAHKSGFKIYASLESELAHIGGYKYQGHWGRSVLMSDANKREHENVENARNAAPQDS